MPNYRTGHFRWGSVGRDLRVAVAAECEVKSVEDLEAEHTKQKTNRRLKCSFWGVMG